MLRLPAKRSCVLLLPVFLRVPLPVARTEREPFLQRERDRVFLRRAALEVRENRNRRLVPHLTHRYDRFAPHRLR